MAIILDAVTSGSGNGATITKAHTCAVGANYLVVALSTYCSDGGGHMASGVTYAGVAMTQIALEVEGGGGWFQSELWGLANPASGANNVVITFIHTGPDKCCYGISSYKGVRGIGTPATVEVNGTSASVNVATSPGDLVVDVMGTYSTATNVTPGAGQTERWDIGTTWPNGAGSDELASGASTTMSWSWTTTNGACLCAIPLLPTPEGGFISISPYMMV